jgi:uncharacterized repeat protein (TIGR01451 family)
MKKNKTTFKRLVSNLPYNPSLINQVAFYAKRLKQETSIRRMGFLFIVLTFLVQLFAVMAPPKSSIASAGNDIKPGGFYSQAEGVAACRSNMNNYGAVLGQLGVSCDDLAAGTARKIDYNEQGGQLYSIGYVPQGFANEQPVDLPNISVRVWARPLMSWGAHCYNDGRGCMAIVGTDSYGRFFMVLFACGNLVTVGPPHPIAPPPPPPPPAPVKTIVCNVLNMNIANGAHIPLGTTVSVQGMAGGSNLPSGERVDMYYDYYNTANKVPSPTQVAQGVPFTGSMAYDQTPRTFKMDLAGHYVFRLTVKYDGSSRTAAGSAVGSCAKDVYVDQDTCKNPNDKDKCEIKNKRAKNITRNIPDANGTTANPGDTIEYTLAITNTYKATAIKGFVIKDQIGDILEYADLVDTGGGKLDAQKNLVYPAVDIKPGQTIEKKFTVKVKDPIPSTPASSSDPGSYDLTMTNVYGDTIKIKVPPKGVKVIEATSTSLPNTGPGENMAIAFVLTAVVGYFFFRSRLLTKELDLVREEYTTGA